MHGGSSLTGISRLPTASIQSNATNGHAEHSLPGGDPQRRRSAWVLEGPTHAGSSATVGGPKGCSIGPSDKSQKEFPSSHHVDHGSQLRVTVSADINAKAQVDGLNGQRYDEWTSGGGLVQLQPNSRENTGSVKLLDQACKSASSHQWIASHDQQ